VRSDALLDLDELVLDLLEITGRAVRSAEWG
jgi:hypothetical protein